MGFLLLHYKVIFSNIKKAITHIFIAFRYIVILSFYFEFRFEVKEIHFMINETNGELTTAAFFENKIKLKSNLMLPKEY